jgi:hypothetical protein
MWQRALIWFVRLLALAAAVSVLAVFLVFGGAVRWAASDSAERSALERPDDPNWQYVKKLGGKAWGAASPREFSQFDDGNWTELCVVGGYMNPVVEFERAYGRADVPETTRRWFERSFPVEEFDLSVIWRDGVGKVSVLYFVHGGDPETQHLARCFARADAAEMTP